MPVRVCIEWPIFKYILMPFLQLSCKHRPKSRSDETFDTSKSNIRVVVVVVLQIYDRDFL